MQTEEKVSEIIQEMADSMPGFIAAALVDLDSGITLGVFSTRSDFDLTTAGAYNSEIVKQKLKVMDALGLDQDLEDITMTLSDQIHMIQLVNATSFLYLAADKAMSNLAIVRNAISKHSPALAA